MRSVERYQVSIAKLTGVCLDHNRLIPLAENGYYIQYTMICDGLGYLHHFGGFAVVIELASRESYLCQGVPIPELLRMPVEIPRATSNLLVTTPASPLER